MIRARFNSNWLASDLGSKRRMKSTVRIVEAELAPESMVDMAAANRAATTNPRNPLGI